MLSVATLGCASAVVVYWPERGGLLSTFGMVLLPAVLVCGLADALLTRLELQEEAMTLRTLRGVRTIERQRIASAGWEAGVGVSLKLVDGTWVKLPHLGNGQGCTNTIRAWLKATT
jgi:hypothetical protein